MSDIPKEPENTLKLKLGDIIQLYSSNNTDLNGEIFIISYIDSKKLILNNPSKAQPVVLTLSDDGTFTEASIEKIDLLNRSDKDGYLAQNNLNIGDLIELLFIEDSGAINKVYGQISNIEEDMMAIALHPSKQEIYIDFAYKGIPLELNLRGINIIDVFPQDIEPQIQDEQPIEQEPQVEEPQVEPEPPVAVDVSEKPLIDTEVYVEPSVDEETLDRSKQIFIDADQLFLGQELGEIRQEVQLGEKERRYGLDTQLSDLLEELLSVVPNEERNQRVLGNINNIIQKFKQLRNEHSEFDEFENANKKPKDEFLNSPLIKSLVQINKNIRWLIPVIKTKKQLNNLEIEDELLQNIEQNNDLDLLLSLDDFINNYYKGDTGNSQNKYDMYLRFMNDYFKSYSLIVNEKENKIIEMLKLDDNKENIDVIIDNLGDMYSEIATSIKKTVEISNSRFKTLTLSGNYNRKQLTKSKMGELNIDTIPISKGDTLQISSFLVLPEKIVSDNTTHINTKIIDKTKTSTDSDYYNYFRNATSIVNKYVGVNKNETNELKFDIAKHAVKSITNQNNIFQIEPSQEFIDALYDLPEDERKGFYITFLSQFLPSSTEILEEINKNGNLYLKHITSLHDLVNKLSAFMVLKDNFTNNEVIVAQKIIDKNILKIKQDLIKRGDELNSLVEQEVTKKKGVDKKDIKNSIELLLQNVPLVDDYSDSDTSNEGQTSSLVIINIIKDSLKSYYNVKDNETSEEVLKIIYDYDGGRFLNLCLTYLTLGLHSTLDINKELNAIDELIQSQIEEKGEDNECQDVVISNKYTTLDELNDDNKKFIYFDKEYDETRYDILDIYREQQNAMSPPQFKEFLKNKLIENVGMNESKAQREADAMINGKRLVEEGNVAILEIKGDTPRYYTRENNEWKRNLSIKFDVQSGSLLCETKKGCYKIKNKCATEELADQLIKASNIQSMINIFDVKREMTRKQLQLRLGKAIQLLYSNKANLDNLDDEQRKEQNEIKKQIASKMILERGVDPEKDVKSPYSRLFQAIMGQEDFVQKQHNIVKFVNQFTYDIDNQHWFLCIKTSQKLIPKFLFRLAKAFVGGDDYYLVREQICSLQGVLSDDGDKWVDKYSGYTIKMVDSSGEEGYDGEGYKLHAREVLEDTVDKIIRERQQEIYTTVSGKETDNTIKFKDSDFTAPYSDIVLKFVNAVSRSIGLDLQTHKPYIVNNVLRLNKANFTTREEYDKQASIVKKQKNITLPSFEIALNLNILLLSACFIILAIQLAKPTMQTRKTVPGCFKYFNGFPYDANGDKNAIVYIACVIDKIKNVNAMPWKSLGKTKAQGLVNKLISKFEKQILKDKHVQDDISEKKAWEIIHAKDVFVETTEEIGKESKLENWNTFRPSLDVNYSVNVVSPLSGEFITEMTDDVKKGTRKYHNNVNTVIGKLIEQSTHYKNLINDIVSTSDMILKNVYQEPHMQNCFYSTPLSDSDITALLNSKNTQIQELIGNILSTQKIVYYLRNTVKSPIMNPHFDTKKQINDDFGDFNEETIYKYFINRCHFADETNIDATLVRLCGSKPFGFDNTLAIEEQIAFLKSNGHQYSNASLQDLLKLIGRRNSVDNDRFIQLYDETHYIFKNFIDKFSKINQQTPLHNYLFDEEVNNKINRVFSLSIPSNGYIADKLYQTLNKSGGALREVKNTLSISIETIKQDIIKFVQSHTNLSRKQKKQVEDYTMLIDKIDKINIKQYDTIKHTMYLSCIVFPNMIINNADFSNIILPKHWGLSEKHVSDVKTIVSNFYTRFKQFYSETTESGEEGLDEIDESQNMIQTFKRVMLLCKPHLKNIYEFLCELPISSQINMDKNIFLLDDRFNTLFVKYIFIKSIQLYVKCATLVNDRNIVLQKYIKSRLGVSDNGDINADRKHEAITEPEIYEFMNQQISDGDVVYNDDMSLFEFMNEYLVETSPLLTKFYEMASSSYDDIYAKVVSSRENEKNTITRTLKDMSDEEREIQNIFKGHKLESWGKGLTKGLTRYVKEDYDEERAAYEKRLNHERQMKNIDVATKMNMEIFMEESEYQNIINQEIENEEYSMEHLGNDDDYGEMDGDEFY